MYKKESQDWLKHLDFIVWDLICLHLAFILAYLWRFGRHNPYMDQKYLVIIVFLSLMDMLIMIIFETLKNALKRGFYKELIYTVRHVCLMWAFLFLYLFTVYLANSYSRKMVYMMGLLYGILSYTFRLMWKKYVHMKRKNVEVRSLFVITCCDKVYEVLENLQKDDCEMYKIVGIAVLDKGMKKKKIEGIPVFTEESEYMDFVCHEWVDEVFLSLPSHASYPNRIVTCFLEMGVVVRQKVLVDSEELMGKPIVERMGDYIVLTRSVRCITLKQAFFKRAMDIAGGLIGCVLTLVLTVVLGTILYIKSPGPIFFHQERIGKNGKPFRIYKFRSMYMDAEEKKAELMEQNRMKDGLMFKMDWDPRIIGSKILPDGTCKKGFGNFIRDFSLDEFPQFFNVLKGDMSLVGTRPPTVDEWEKYEQHHRVRMATKPGITGLWQVSGRSNITDFEEVVKLDMKYITDWSVGLDIKILLQTIKVVLKRDGSM